MRFYGTLKTGVPQGSILDPTLYTKKKLKCKIFLKT